MHSSKSKSVCPAILSRYQSGFTLVELLVVIGIIAVLISLLLPALARARQSAEQTKCLSNLHQIVLAANIYITENKGDLLPSGGVLYPLPLTDTIGTVTGSYFRSWYYERVTNTAFQNAYDFKRGLLGPYLQNANILVDPAMANLNLVAGQGTPPQPNTTYGLGDYDGLRVTAIQNISETAMFGDAIGYISSNGTISQPVQLSPPSAGAANGDYFCGPHGKGYGCVGFFDGHASPILSQPRAIFTYASYVSSNPTLYSQLQALHIGPCMKGTIDYTQATDEASYSTLCTNYYDYYFWASKSNKK